MKFAWRQQLTGDKRRRLDVFKYDACNPSGDCVPTFVRVRPQMRVAVLSHLDQTMPTLQTPPPINYRNAVSIFED